MEWRRMMMMRRRRRRRRRVKSKLRWMLGPRDWLPQIHQEE